MIKVKTLTNAYQILEPMFEILRTGKSHESIEDDGEIMRFTVIDDGGNNGVWIAIWNKEDYNDYQFLYNGMAT